MTEMMTQAPAGAAPIADPMVNMIERVISDPSVDLAKLERMLAIKERLDEKAAQKAYAQALAAARAETPPILKDAEVDVTTNKGRTHYKHETLASIATVIKAKALGPASSDSRSFGR